MCLYRYVYYSRCQHSEFLRVSYCDRAKALGHPQRDDRYRRAADADNPPEPPPDYPSHSSSSHLSSVMQPPVMPTLIPSEAAVNVAWASRDPAVALPKADQIPRSVHAYGNVNVDIPLDTQSSLSVKLTDDGKSMELVTRYESFSGHEISDVEKAHYHGNPRHHGNAATVRDSQEECHILFLSDSDDATERASSTRIGSINETGSTHPDRITHSPRKPIPSPWKTTMPRAPVFATDRRSEEREKRKPVQGSDSPTRSSRGAHGSTFLTKDAIKAVDSDITVPWQGSPVKTQRLESKASLRSPSSSPKRNSPHQATTLKIQVLPARSANLKNQGQEAVPDMQDREMAASIAPSVISNHGTEYHSAYSPVSMVPSRTLSRRSSRDTWHTAEDHFPEPSPLSLTGADDIEQRAAPALNDRGYYSTQSRLSAQPISHSRSKTESRLPGQKSIKPAVPKLTLRIPAAGPSSFQKPAFKSGSASTSHSGSPVSPTKAPSSRIPRVAPTYDAGTTASRLKRSQSAKALRDSQVSSIARSGQVKGKGGAVMSDSNEGVQMSLYNEASQIPAPSTPVAVPTLRHVRTLNSAGKTPIVVRHPQPSIGGQPYVNARVASYLDGIDPNVHPDHTPFTEDHVSIDENEKTSDRASRKTSASTVKAVSNTIVEDPKQIRAPGARATDETHWHHDVKGFSRAQMGIFSEVEPREHLSASSGYKTVGTQVGHDIEGTPAIETTTLTDSEAKPELADQESRERIDQHMLRGRIHSASSPSLRSQQSSDLRATAPEFVPKSQNEIVLQDPGNNVMNLPWMLPFGQSLAFDPFALDNYGMPWFFHMYPVQMRQPWKSPKKHRPVPRGRRRGDTSVTPKKPFRPVLIEETPREEGKLEEQESSRDVVSPFATQLDEIARNAAAHRDQGTSNHAHRGYATMPPRSGRPIRNVGNGLYDTIGRGRLRAVGIPMEATAPFPDPIAPLGRTEHARYAIEPTQDGCGVVDIDRAAEWVGKACNTCEPDH